jgi:predicted nuclease of restriction endonuclease-like RecB superfamily
VVVQLAFKAAARAFAVANPTVQTRLWRALATQQSIVRHSKLSLDELTELYIVRDE